MLNDEYVKPNIRVNLMGQNSEDFAKDWNCTNDSPMNPVDKCTIF